MWYTITCPDCGRRITTFADHDETAVKALYGLIEKHELQYKHRDPNLEKPEYDVETWVRQSFTRANERDESAYEY